MTERRKRLCDYSLVFAAFGLVLMIIETELSMANVYTKVSNYSATIDTFLLSSSMHTYNFVFITECMGGR